ETEFCGKLSSDAITWAAVCARHLMRYWMLRSKRRALLQSRACRPAPFAMPSDRKIAANRQNSQRSTGPRTALAKERIRRNALRHGLSAAIVNAAGIPAETNRLAQSICVHTLVLRNASGLRLLLSASFCYCACVPNG